MAEQKKQGGVYRDDNMVHVIVDGQVLPNKVPSKWIGSDLLPEGAKKATKSQVEKSEAGENPDSDES